MTDVEGNCRRVLQRIEDAAVRSGRSPGSVRLVAVTKTVSVDSIRRAIDCGITDVGESKLQEALPKLESIGAVPGLTWHFIGHIQTNKARRVAENFDCVHSVDRLEVAQALARGIGNKILPVFLEVKLDLKETKSGILPSELGELIPAIKTCAGLDLRGLMTIPPQADSAEQSRPFFRKLRELAANFGLPELSMGMTHDFEVAVEEGTTMVRVGTAIFGERQ